eukprot:2244125-Rhodomonas_salina.1
MQQTRQRQGGAAGQPARQPRAPGGNAAARQPGAPGQVSDCAPLLLLARLLSSHQNTTARERNRAAGRPPQQQVPAQLISQLTEMGILLPIFLCARGLCGWGAVRCNAVLYAADAMCDADLWTDLDAMLCSSGCAIQTC